jgi:two-component system, OmpR family, phosphate regulon response regulator OmpR
MPSPLAHILVVDDDPRLRNLLERYLRQNGYLVSAAGDAAEARARLEQIAFDLIVLDVMLPDMDGVTLTRSLRRSSEIPVLLLTARGEPEDRIAGLEGGADDYLVKPFEPRELLLRITRILGRTQTSGEEILVRFGPFTFDTSSTELTRDGQVIHLTTGEASLLRILAAQAGRPISRAELGARSRITGSDRAVDVQIVRLRRKIEEDPRQPRYLLTVRSEGYVLRPGN